MPFLYQVQLQACSLSQILIRKCVAVVVRALRKEVPLVLFNVFRGPRGRADLRYVTVPQQSARNSVDVNSWRPIDIDLIIQAALRSCAAHAPLMRVTPARMAVYRAGNPVNSVRGDFELLNYHKRSP